MGRFITADPTIQSPYDPQDLNRYSYCRNNPINYVDPSGNFWNFIFAALTFISVVSATVSIVSTIAAMATGSQTWANIAKISGIISMATGITAVIGNSIRAAIASQPTQLASAQPSIELEKIVITKARIAQQQALSFIKFAKLGAGLLIGAGVGAAVAPLGLTTFGLVVVGSAAGITTEAILTQIEKWVVNKLKIPQ